MSKFRHLIKRASRQNTRIKMALVGISGSGKTYSALSIARGLGDRVLLIDTEHGSASKYSEFQFDTIELDTHDPRNFVECIRLAETEGYDVLIIDSLSHAWMGREGALELVDNAAKRSNSGNSFAAWRNVTPLHNQLIDAIVGCRIHLIATMRAKTEYVQERDERTGKTTPRKIGLAPVQRDQMEYEFDIVGDLTQEHELVITKTRCTILADQVVARPGAELAETLKEWLSGDEPAPEPTRCDCGIEARHIRSRSGRSGYVCGYYGREGIDICDFRLMDDEPAEPAAGAAVPVTRAPAPTKPAPAATAPSRGAAPRAAPQAAPTRATGTEARNQAFAALLADAELYSWAWDPETSKPSRELICHDLSEAGLINVTEANLPACRAVLHQRYGTRPAPDTAPAPAEVPTPDAFTTEP